MLLVLSITQRTACNEGLRRSLIDYQLVGTLSDCCASIFIFFKHVFHYLSAKRIEWYPLSFSYSSAWFTIEAKLCREYSYFDPLQVQSLAAVLENNGLTEE